MIVPLLFLLFSFLLSNPIITTAFIYNKYVTHNTKYRHRDHHHHHLPTTTRTRTANIDKGLRQCISLSSSKSSSSSTSSSSNNNNNNNNNDNSSENSINGPDLFDYFDPLLSPHEYPNGIKPPSQNNKEVANNQKSHSKSTSLNGSKKKKTTTTMEGWDDDTTSRSKTTSSSQTSSSSASSSSTATSDFPDIDLFDYFDPLLSPHEYANGISPQNIRKELVMDNNNDNNNNNHTKTIGILLIDHGSKKQASNERLQQIAKIYQSTLDHNGNNNNINNDENNNSNNNKQHNIIVKAAHMEIATPTISDGIKELMDLNVDEIICHPYFLSPSGKHVQEDIPKLIEDAVKQTLLQQQQQQQRINSNKTTTVPIITTTEPTGSNIDMMLNAVHTLVIQNSQILSDK